MLSYASPHIKQKAPPIFYTSPCAFESQDRFPSSNESHPPTHPQLSAIHLCQSTYCCICPSGCKNHTGRNIPPRKGSGAASLLGRRRSTWWEECFQCPGTHGKALLASYGLFVCPSRATERIYTLPFPPPQQHEDCIMCLPPLTATGKQSMMQLIKPQDCLTHQRIPPLQANLGLGQAGL